MVVESGMGRIARPILLRLFRKLAPGNASDLACYAAGHGPRCFFAAGKSSDYLQGAAGEADDDKANHDRIAQLPADALAGSGKQVTALAVVELIKIADPSRSAGGNVRRLIRYDQ